LISLQNLRDCGKQREEGSGKTTAGSGAATVHSQGRHSRPPPRGKKGPSVLLGCIDAEQTQRTESPSMEVEAAATLLVGILSKRGIETTAKQLVKFIKLGQQWGHFVDTQLLFSVLEWQELGETMWEKTVLGEEKEEKEIKAVRDLW